MRKSPSNVRGSLVTPVIDYCEEAYPTVTALSTTATAIPAANRSERKGISIYNLDAAITIYIAAVKPQGVRGFLNHTWTESAAVPGEWYLARNSSAATAPSEPLQLYSKLASDSDEVARTAGTVGALTANTWDWGDGDTLGYNTLYVCPPTGLAPADAYSVILSYYRLPTTSGATTGHPLKAEEAIFIPLSGKTRVFAIAASGTPNVQTTEYV
uniref:Uncharacterized protein n=1 Tax=viral metagenome TaxID=1070528 RepID=A0A6H1ZGU2_9ZZZZ